MLKIRNEEIGKKTLNIQRSVLIRFASAAALICYTSMKIMVTTPCVCGRVCVCWSWEDLDSYIDLHMSRRVELWPC